jgi:hypothetical protein
MNLDLTTREMETLLSLTAGMAHHSEECNSIWRKVSKEVMKQLPFKTENEVA